jgi:hypothetical protein
MATYNYVPRYLYQSSVRLLNLCLLIRASQQIVAQAIFVKHYYFVLSFSVQAGPSVNSGFVQLLPE